MAAAFAPRAVDESAALSRYLVQQPVMVPLSFPDTVALMAWAALLQCDTVLVVGSASHLRLEAMHTDYSCCSIFSVACASGATRLDADARASVFRLQLYTILRELVERDAAEGGVTVVVTPGVLEIVGRDNQGYACDAAPVALDVSAIAIHVVASYAVPAVAAATAVRTAAAAAGEDVADPTLTVRGTAHALVMGDTTWCREESAAEELWTWYGAYSSTAAAYALWLLAQVVGSEAAATDAGGAGDVVHVMLTQLPHVSSDTGPLFFKMMRDRVVCTVAVAPRVPPPPRGG